MRSEPSAGMENSMVAGTHVGDAVRCGWGGGLKVVHVGIGMGGVGECAWGVVLGLRVWDHGL